MLIVELEDPADCRYHRCLANGFVLLILAALQKGIMYGQQ